MRQRYGQHFLTDANIARKIVAAAELSPADTVIEIGPGKGILTELMAPLVRELIAVEIDGALAEKLRERFGARAGVRIVHGDFLRFPAHALPPPVNYVSNLPYSVATAILEKVLPLANWQRAVVMVQKEVGERIAAPCGTRAYGAFSIFSQYYARVERIVTVHPGSFSPPPEVDSAVLRLENMRPGAPDPLLFPLVRRAFEQRRKTILNSLSHALGCPKTVLSAALQQAGIAPAARPETVSREQFEALTFILKKDIILNSIPLTKTSKK